MGLAASQARMLMLFARKSDLEFRGQTINSRRLAISTRESNMAVALADKLAVITYSVKKGDEDWDISKTHLGLVGVKAYNANGTEVPDGTSAADIEAGLKNGTIYLKQLQKKDKETDPDVYEGIDFATAPIIQRNGITDLNRAILQAKYDADLSVVQTQDRQLELELKNVDTAHSAIQTEVDAVKKVIDKNIESSFKTFG